MRNRLALFLALLLLIAQGCSPSPDSPAFGTQVAREISATQTAQAAGPKGAWESLYEPIQPSNAGRLELLKTFSGDPITSVAAAAEAQVLVYASSSGIHLLDPATLEETGLIAASGQVYNLTVSADGRFLAAVDAGAVRIWSLPDLSLQGSVEGTYTDQLAFSPDGRLLTGIDWDGVYGWQVPDGRQRFSTEEAADWLGNPIGGGGIFAFSPTDDRIVFPQITFINDSADRNASIDMLLYAVDPGSGEVEELGWSREMPKTQETSVSGLAFSPGGERFAVGWTAYPVELWRMGTGTLELEFTFPPQTTDARQVAYSADGKYLGIVTRDGSIQLWDAQARELRHEWEGRQMEFLAGSSLAALVTGTQLQVVDLGSGAEILARPYADAQGAAVLPNGSVIAIRWNDDRVELWGQRGQTLERTLQSGLEDLAYIYYQPYCDCLAAVARQGQTVLWQAPNWEPLALPEGLRHLHFSSSLNLIVTQGPDPNQVLVWGESMETPLFTLKHAAEVQGVRLSPAQPVLAVLLADGTVWFWDLKDGSFLRSLDDYLEWDNIDGFSGDGHLLATTGDNNTIKIWSVEDGRLLYSQEIGFEMEDASLTPSADAVVIDDWENGVTHLWRFGSSEIQQFPGSFNGFTASGDGFFTGTYDEIKVWRVADGSEVRTFPIRGLLLNYSSDGSLLFISRRPADDSSQPRLEIVDFESGEILASMETEGFLYQLQLSMDGSTLAGVSGSGTIQVWGIP